MPGRAQERNASTRNSRVIRLPRERSGRGHMELPVDEDNPLRQVIINTHSPSVVACVDNKTHCSSARLFQTMRDGAEESRLAVRYLPATSRQLGNEPVVTRGDPLSYLNPLSVIVDDDDEARGGEEEGHAARGSPDDVAPDCCGIGFTTLISTLLTDGSSNLVLSDSAMALRESRDRPGRGSVGGSARTANATVRPSGANQRAVELYPVPTAPGASGRRKQPASDRFDEIEQANRTGLPHVCVVPVRMQESWLLHDESALRRAAGRPSGTEPLDLPPAKSWEILPDPKDVLHRALTIRASGAKGRRAKQFKPQVAAHRLANLIEDWSPLRRLPAFQKLETDMLNALVALGHA